MTYCSARPPASCLEPVTRPSGHGSNAGGLAARSPKRVRRRWAAAVVEHTHLRKSANCRARTWVDGAATTTPYRAAARPGSVRDRTALVERSVAKLLLPQLRVGRSNGWRRSDEPSGAGPHATAFATMTSQPPTQGSGRRPVRHHGFEVTVTIK